ncbi:surface-adhesin E family protein [Orbus wheelerorum]|uniref:surface-adhesin E family protein n=1 Tax=Orbus wheelerorum TaxID=3074111 RepID=UPI00370CFEAE
MKKTNYLSISLIGLVISIFASATLANDTTKVSKETTLNNTIPSQYLPIAKINLGTATSYVFIDKKSVKFHPYNQLIRTYTRVTNYVPALSQTIDGTTVTYQSKVTQEFVNCDKKEYAEHLVEIYQNPFGTGQLYDSNDLPKRWEATTNNEKEKQNMIIICALPINN